MFLHRHSYKYFFANKYMLLNDDKLLSLQPNIICLFVIGIIIFSRL